MKDVKKRPIRNEQIRQTGLRKRKRRKRNYTLHYILLFLFVTIAGIMLSMTVFFNIEEVKVLNSKTYSSKQIVEKSGISVGNNLLRVNSKDISKKIVNSLINVESVSIKRSLPSTLIITITEATPFYNVMSNGKYMSVSKGGKVVAINLDKPIAKIMTINGIASKDIKLGDLLPQKNSSKFELLTTISDTLKEFKVTEVTNIDILNSADITFIYQDRIKVSIGSVADLRMKVKFVKEIVSNRISAEETGTIDAKNPVKVYFEPTPSEPTS